MELNNCCPIIKKFVVKALYTKKNNCICAINWVRIYAFKICSKMRAVRLAIAMVYWFHPFYIVLSISWHIAGVYDVSISFMPYWIMCNEIREESVQYLQAWWLKRLRNTLGMKTVQIMFRQRHSLGFLFNDFFITVKYFRCNVRT